MCCLMLVSCSRYGNIPRQNRFFDRSVPQVSENLNKHNPKAVQNDAKENLQTGIGSPEEETAEEEPELPATADAIHNSIIGFKNSSVVNTGVNGLRSAWNGQKNKRRTVEKVKHPAQNDVPDDEPVNEEPEFNLLALVSMLLGLTAWALLIMIGVFTLESYGAAILFLSFLAAIGAIITGIIALSLTKETRGVFSNRYMAWIGLITGAIEVVLAILLVSLFIVAFGF